jgi:hypothetical protein
MASTHKKVIVRKMSRDTVQGFVTPDEFIADGRLSLLNTAGNLVSMELADVKSINFVRDFTESGELTRRTFTSRPRTEGLWVKLEFKDNETLEGLLPNDLVQLANEGFLLTPPDTRGNVQRIFVPKTALNKLMVLSVVGGTKSIKPAKIPIAQEALFNE